MTPPRSAFGAPPQGGRAGQGTVPADGASPASAGGVLDAGAAAGPAKPVPGRPLGWLDLRARFRRWLYTRLPPTDTWLLGQRNIYILPTRAGFTFALTLLVMLLASINYQLNLGYALTFLLAGAGIVSMHITHGNLRGLTLHLRPAAPVFAGEPALLEVVITNPGHERHGLALHLQQPGSDTPDKPQPQAWCDAPRGGQGGVHLSLVPAHRGWHAVPPVVVETLFPFGLFRAWTVWRPATRVLAWPRPEQPPPPLPHTAAKPGEERAGRRGTGSELDGVRPWKRGDTMRQVVWKKVARSGELVSRETAGTASRELWLDWAEAHAATGELRLSRLAAWVLRAEREGIDYGLMLPGRQLPPGTGEMQRRAALDLLALWQA